MTDHNDASKQINKIDDTLNLDGNFDHIQISIASDESIEAASRGEVKKAETVNYRSHKVEKEVFSAKKSFGPTKDWEWLW